MTPTENHLSEEQRQRAADHSLAPDQEIAVTAHLRACVECAADVARLARVVALARTAGATGQLPDDMWPSIRERIEQKKVVALPTALGAAAVAVLAIFALGRYSARLGGTPEVVADAVPDYAIVADSSTAYEEQARILLDRLSLQRSLIRPEALAAIERDLRVVDSAIAELDVAVARDPSNPVLRRLLASSYREKVDILKRVANAE